MCVHVPPFDTGTLNALEMDYVTETHKVPQWGGRTAHEEHGSAESGSPQQPKK